MKLLFVLSVVVGGGFVGQTYYQKHVLLGVLYLAGIVLGMECVSSKLILSKANLLVIFAHILTPFV